MSRRALPSTLTLCLLALAAQQGRGQETKSAPVFKAGFAERDITPESAADTLRRVMNSK